MNTIENNKLIAEFMGNKPFAKDNFGNDLYNNPMNEIKFSHKNPTDMCDYEFEYHTSWDWLMPVVDKIESLIFDENNSYNVTIGSTNYCVIQDSNGDSVEIIKDNGETKLETVYQAVVQFINQYNNQ